MSKKRNEKSSQPADKLAFLSLSSDASVKIPAWKLASQPLKLLFCDLKTFLLAIFPTAALLSICSLLFRRSILCGTESALNLNTSMCADNAVSFYGDMICRFIILVLFAVKWYEFALQKRTPTKQNLLHFDGKTIKSIGVAALFMIINILPAFALLILMFRVPNPDWRIELAFFTSVAWVFLLPLLAVRFYSVLGFCFAGEKIPPLKAVWKNTSGNMLKLLLSVAMIVFLALFVFLQYYGVIQGLNDYGVGTAIMAEYEYDVLVVIFTALCTNYCYTQKELLFEGDRNEQ